MSLCSFGICKNDLIVLVLCPGYTDIYQTRNRFPNTGEKAENTTRRGIFLTNFQLFGNVVKYCLECFSIESKTKAKTEK